jgi:hypothetical protein
VALIDDIKNATLVLPTRVYITQQLRRTQFFPPLAKAPEAFCSAEIVYAN